MPAWLLALLLDAQGSPRELVERLRSDSVEERQEVEQRLIALGRAAAPELERAARDPDRELAERARLLLRILDLDARLSPALKKSIPGIERRLAAGGDAAFTRIFLETRGKGLPAADLEPLVLPAFRGAVQPEDKIHVIHGVLSYGFRSAVPALARCLGDPDPGTRAAAAEALGTLGAREQAPELLPVLAGADEDSRLAAFGALLDLRARALAPDIEALLDSPIPEVRADVLGLLSRLYAYPSAPAIRRRLRDPHADVRSAAVVALSDLDLPVPPEDLGFLLDLQDKSTQAALYSLDPMDVDAGKLPLPLLLRSRTPDLRKAAVGVLRKFRARKSAPLLLPLLEDPDAQVRAAAMEAADELDLREAIPILADLLGRGERDDRRNALQALRRLGARGAVDAVRRRVEDADAGIRAAAIDILRDLGAKAALPEILGRLHDADKTVRNRACSAVGTLGSAANWKDVADLLGGADDELRRGAPSQLADWRATEAVDPLRRALEHADAETRAAAATALHVLSPPDGIAAWRRLLADADPDLRRRAAEQLGWIDPSAALEDAAKLARSPDRDGRLTGLLLLEAARSDAGAALLEAARKDPDPGVRAEAERIGRGNEDAPAAATVSPDPEARAEAVVLWRDILHGRLEGNRKEALEALGRLGEKEDVLRALREYEELRDGAIGILPALLGREALPLLRGLLDDPDGPVRAGVVKAFLELGAAGEAPLLLPLLEDENPEVREQAITALGRFGATTAAPRIARFLRSRRTSLRQAAVHALADLGARDAAPAIARLLRQGPLEVAGDCLEALVALKAKESAGDIAAYLAETADLHADDAAAALGLLDARDRVPFLRETLRHPRATARFGAVRALSRLGASGAAAEELLPLLEDADVEVRREVLAVLLRDGHARGKREALKVLADVGSDDQLELLWLLEQIPLPEAVPALLRLSQQPSEHVVVAALDALAAAGETKAAPEIAKLLRRPEGWIRATAVHALGRLDSLRPDPEILRLLRDPDGRVREAVARRLCIAGFREGAAAADVVGLSPLNALRKPALWKRLETARVQGPLAGTYRGILAGLATSVGLTAELPELPWLAERDLLGWAYSAGSVRTALDERRLMGFGMILEEDRIRYVPVGEARVFWAAWLAGN